MTLLEQLAWLLILPLPIACIAWTVTQEEFFREPRDYCTRQSQDSKSIVRRKFFYLFTCEYCFSHYVCLGVILLTEYKLLIDDWRGYFLSQFALVWMANLYMSLFKLLRQNIKKDISVIKTMERAEREAE